MANSESKAKTNRRLRQRFGAKQCNHTRVLMKGTRPLITNKGRHEQSRKGSYRGTRCNSQERVARAKSAVERESAVCPAYSSFFSSFFSSVSAAVSAAVSTAVSTAASAAVFASVIFSGLGVEEGLLADVFL